MNLTQATAEERILLAAKDVFMKHGLYGARMQDIADAAKINKALLHYYFRTKEKLFDTVFEGALERFFQKTDVFSDASLPFLKRMQLFANNLIDFLEEYPQMSMFIIKETSLHPELFKQKVSHLKKAKSISFLNALEQAIANHEIKKIDPVLFMINLQSLCAYPFLAAPLFKHIVKSSHKDWHDFNTLKLKESVKHFIEISLQKDNK